MKLLLAVTVLLLDSCGSFVLPLSSSKLHVAPSWTSSCVSTPVASGTYDKVFGETNGVAHVGLAGYEHEPVFGDACFVVACALRLSNVVGGETRELCHVRTMYVYFWKHVFIDADILTGLLFQRRTCAFDHDLFSFWAKTPTSQKAPV